MKTSGISFTILRLLESMRYICASRISFAWLLPCISSNGDRIRVGYAVGECAEERLLDEEHGGKVGPGAVGHDGDKGVYVGEPKER
jgi:hypothetical protein